MEWEKAVDLAPEHDQALYQLSRMFAEQDPLTAKAYRDRVRTVKNKGQNSDRAEMLSFLAAASAKAGNVPQAIAQFREALDLCEGCRLRGDLLKSLGLAYCHVGDLKNGERHLREALELRPGDADVQKSLQIIEARTGSASRQ